MRRFELIEGTASKFWEIEQADTELNIRWGRIGTAGQSQTKSFADATKAAAALTKLVTEKTGKGYGEVGVDSGAAIGKTEAKPKPEAAPETQASAPASKAASGVAAEPAPAAQEPSSPSESIDAQADRAFEAVRAQLEADQLKPTDALSAAMLKRQHGVSEQAAALAFKRLKD
uniref:WGR domain-containing protein n=1 Tax=uncultured Variovorax sp. TaxID=114708 RepID=UPI0025CFA7D1